MSKGDSRRPAAVPRETVDANYEHTFRKPSLFVTEGSYLVQRLAAKVAADVDAQYGRTPSGPTDAEA